MKTKATLKAGEKVVYITPYLKPSITEVIEELDGRVMLSNRVQIKSSLDKKGRYQCSNPSKDSYAIPLNEESQKLIDSLQFYFSAPWKQLDLQLKSLKDRVFKDNGDIDYEKVDQLLSARKLVVKLNKVLEVE